ncbi:MAG: hypothetical protein IPG79_03345 [Saprospiraceae bacterium]|nr:hypothetical protein [Saprospiraceae bacterium]
MKFIAIAIDISDVKGQVFDSIYKKLEKSILDRNNQGLILYNWNESNSEVIYSGKNKIAERPVNSVLFMKASGFFDMYPPLKAQFDTLGNLTNMFLEMKRHLTFHVSHVDVATGVQIKNEQIDLIPSKNPDQHSKIPIILKAMLLPLSGTRF